MKGKCRTMSTLTTTGFKNTILQYTADHGIAFPESKARRMGNEIKRRFERMSDLDRERLIMHSDPVPCEVLHHILGSTPCRRCGRSPHHT